MPMCMGKDKCSCHKLGFVLVLVGALNLGLVGLGGFFGGDWDLLHMVLGGVVWLENLVYLLVGLSALMMLFGCKCKKCKGSGGCCGGEEKPAE